MGDSGFLAGVAAARQGGHLPGDTGNGNGGDDAVSRFISSTDAIGARCGFGILLLDSNFPARLYVSFGPIAVLSATALTAWNHVPRVQKDP